MFEYENVCAYCSRLLGEVTRYSVEDLPLCPACDGRERRCRESEKK